MMTTTGFPPEEGWQFLVPRLVRGSVRNDLHICMADSRFREEAVITVKALCGEWLFGMLTLQTPGELRALDRFVPICAECESIHSSGQE